MCFPFRGKTFWPTFCGNFTFKYFVSPPDIPQKPHSMFSHCCIKMHAFADCALLYHIVLTPRRPTAALLRLGKLADRGDMLKPEFRYLLYNTFFFISSVCVFCFSSVFLVGPNDPLKESTNLSFYWVFQWFVLVNLIIHFHSIGFKPRYKPL